MSKMHDAKEELVKNSFFKFVQTHINDANLSELDEILMPYIVSILEEISSQNYSQDAFDVDHFTEMMSAYLPQFIEINTADVTKWMFDLAIVLAKFKKEGEINHEDDQAELEQNFRTIDDKTNPKAEFSTEEDSDRSSEKDELDEQDDLQTHLLQEMFPTECIAEVRHCLCIADGNTEKAAQLLLHRQETGESLTMNKPVQAQKLNFKKEQDDNELRQHILSRYMYVDQSDDKREHKPVAPKWEPKKLVRYRNNQIVTLKGEKYTEVHTTESEEVKKSYVSLKPARQYRFH